MKSINKKQVMSRAWELYRGNMKPVFSSDFGKALKQAWVEAKFEAASKASRDSYGSYDMRTRSIPQGYFLLSESASYRFGARLEATRLGYDVVGQALLGFEKSRSGAKAKKALIVKGDEISFKLKQDDRADRAGKTEYQEKLNQYSY